MTKVKKEEVFSVAETYVSPQMFPEMRPVGGYVDRSRRRPARIALAIMSAVAVILLLAGNVFFSSAKTEVKAERARIEQVCAVDISSKECRYLKAAAAIKANLGRSWSR